MVKNPNSEMKQIKKKRIFKNRLQMNTNKSHSSKEEKRPKMCKKTSIVEDVFMCVKCLLQYCAIQEKN